MISLTNKYIIRSINNILYQQYIELKYIINIIPIVSHIYQKKIPSCNILP